MSKEWPLARKAYLERVAHYRKRYPHDQRSDKEIHDCIERIKKDSRYDLILLEWAVAQDGFGEDELNTCTLDPSRQNQ